MVCQRSDWLIIFSTPLKVVLVFYKKITFSPLCVLFSCCKEVAAAKMRGKTKVGICMVK